MCYGTDQRRELLLTYSLYGSTARGEGVMLSWVVVQPPPQPFQVGQQPLRFDHVCPWSPWGGILSKCASGVRPQRWPIRAEIC